MSRIKLANPLTSWDSHVKLPLASAQVAKGHCECLYAPSSFLLLQAYAFTQRSICYVDLEDHSKPG